MKKFKNSFGFTLVEMMIVVAIIGILSTLAKYGYDNYQESARQSEAKMSLPQLATSQEQFKTEFGSYTTDINAAKFIRKDVAGAWYNTGMKATTACGAVDNGVYGSSTGSYTFMTGSQTNWVMGAGCTYARANPRAILGGAGLCDTAAEQVAELNSAAGNPNALRYNMATFTAAAVGLISGGKQCDVWNITQNGNMVQVKSGK